MPDETTVNPMPVNTPVPQVPETPISTAPEAVIALASVEVPTEPVPDSTPTTESPSGHLGGNDPIEPAPTESTSPTSAVETLTPEPVPKSH